MSCRLNSIFLTTCISRNHSTTHFTLPHLKYLRHHAISLAALLSRGVLQRSAVLCHHVNHYHKFSAQHGKHTPPSSISHFDSQLHHGAMGHSVPYRQLDVHLHLPHHIRHAHPGRQRRGNASPHRGAGLIGRGKTSSPGRPKCRDSRAALRSSCCRSMRSIGFSSRA